MALHAEALPGTHNATMHHNQHYLGSLDPHHTNAISWIEPNDSEKPFVIPVVGLIIGLLMTFLSPSSMPVTKTSGKLVLYFGAQSFMNIYMGWVMRSSVTVPKGTAINGQTLENDLHGCPAGFALTALQQIVSFVVFMIFFFILYWTPYKYVPRQLNGWKEKLCVVVFGCVFALNIALNNFSLGYISIAVNLIIRSCLPLTTFLSQQGLSLCKLYPLKQVKPLEIILMLVGVVCAGAFTVARILGSGHSQNSRNAVLGVLICIASLLCGSMNLALAGVLGEMKLNVYDTVAYMAIPATLFLTPIALFLEKPVPGEWPKVLGKETMTDFEILWAIKDVSTSTMSLVMLSGVFSFIYNIIQFSIVHTLTPSATAFGGNFNKAALIFLTLTLPFLQVHALPGAPYIQVIWTAVIGNILAFSAYSYLQIKAKQEASKVLEEVIEGSSSSDTTQSDSEQDESSSMVTPEDDYEPLEEPLVGK